AETAIDIDGGHRLWLGVHDRYAYLFFTAADDTIVYESSPGQSPYGDRLLLAVEPRSGPADIFLLGTRAPGLFRARGTGPPLFAPIAEYEDRIQGVWQETPGGFSVEVRLPLGLVGDALGVAFIDVDPAAGMDANPAAGAGLDPAAAEYRVDLRATWDVEQEAPGAL